MSDVYEPIDVRRMRLEIDGLKRERSRKADEVAEYDREIERR